MRKVLALAAVAALAVAAVAAPASAGKKKKKPPAPRTAEGTYASPAVGVGGVGGACLGANGCVEFPITGDEAYIMLASEDQSGTPAFLRITQDLDGDNNGEPIANACGSTTEPVAVTPGVPVEVFVYPNGVAPCAGVGTSGTVTATIAVNPELLTEG